MRDAQGESNRLSALRDRSPSLGSSRKTSCREASNASSAICVRPDGTISIDGYQLQISKARSKLRAESFLCSCRKLVGESKGTGWR